MSKIRLREAQFNEADLEQIWHLLRQQFQSYASSTLSEFRELCRHAWLDNPARGPEHVFGWVLESSSKEIGGFLGLVAVKMKIGNHAVAGGAAHAWAVSPAFRASSLGLYRELFASWGSRNFLLNTTASAQTTRVHEKSVMQKIPISSINQRLLWLVRPEVLVGWVLNKPEWKWLGVVTQYPPFSQILTGAARIWYVRHRRLKFHSQRLPVDQVTYFSDEFDRLWEDNKKDYDITVVRDRAFLDWCHLKMPGRLGQNFVFACRDEGKVLGYIAIREKNPEMGLFPGYFSVVDLFYERRRRDVLLNLLNHAFEFAKTCGCSVFEVARISPEILAELSRQRPYVVDPPGWSYWYKAPSEDLAEICRTASWWPSGVDGDAGL